MKNRKLLKYIKILSSLSFVAMLDAIYLIYLHYTPAANSFCYISEAFNCDSVNQSIYSEFFGIPVAILGALFYGSILIFGLLFIFKNSLFKKVDLKDAINALFLIIMGGVGFAIYLTYVEAMILHEYCILCLFQQVLVIFMSLTVWKAKKLT